MPTQGKPDTHTAGLQGAPGCLGDEPTTIMTLSGYWTSEMSFAREKSGKWWPPMFLGGWGSHQLEGAGLSTMSTPLGSPL